MQKLLAIGCLFLAACSSMQAQKTDSGQKTEVEMILHARKGSVHLQNGKGALRLVDVDKNVSLLSIAPKRQGGAILLKDETINDWNKQFATSAPNASLFYFINGEGAVVALKLQSLTSDTQDSLTFDVEALDQKNQNLKTSFEESSLFIDASQLTPQEKWLEALMLK